MWGGLLSVVKDPGALVARARIWGSRTGTVRKRRECVCGTIRRRRWASSPNITSSPITTRSMPDLSTLRVCGSELFMISQRKKETGPYQTHKTSNR